MANKTQAQIKAEVKDTEKAEAAKAEIEAKKKAEAKAKEDAEEKKAEVTEAKVIAANGGYARTYTEEHSDAKDVKDGKDFIEKAKGYAKKIGGTVELV